MGCVPGKTEWLIRLLSGKKRLRIRVCLADSCVLTKSTGWRPLHSALSTNGADGLDRKGVNVCAKYGRSTTADEQAKHRLEVGSYSGMAGDSHIIT